MTTVGVILFIALMLVTWLVFRCGIAFHAGANDEPLPRGGALVRYFYTLGRFNGGRGI